MNSDSGNWDNFINECCQSTFMHSRKFLSYHKNKFHDDSIFLEEDGKYIAAFPAAKSVNNDQTIISHPGITFGGLLHKGNLKGDATLKAFDLIKDYYSKRGYKKLVYKSIPHIYHKAPCEDDLYALFRMNAKLIRCDLTSSIDNYNRLKISDRRKRALKKAIRNEITIEESSIFLKEFWSILEINLQEKHKKFPVHHLDEISLLSSLFPEDIRCICALHNSKVVAGVLLFESAMVSHAQYIASNGDGLELSALDLVFDYCINSSKHNHKRWFDFGISNENNGLDLNKGLYTFKSEFGAGGITHEFYEIDLREAL